MESLRSERWQTLLLWTLALAVLSPWLYYQSQAMLNGNVSWLLIAADRMINGQSMAESIYETNPPLSILIYIPHIIFSRLFNLDVPTGAAILTVIMIILSLIATREILKSFDFLNRGESEALLFGTLASLTIITTIYFLDREHLMLTALIPFILCQYALTKNLKIKKMILHLCLFFGSIALLVKPHYGLLPALFFLHRAVVQRRTSVCFDPDFIALFLTTLGYLALLWFAYQDYLQIIFPDVVDFYLVGNDKAQTLGLFKPHFSAYLAFLCLEFFLEDLDRKKRNLVLFLYCCALLSLIPLLIQMKGFYNHLLPAFSFFIMGVSLTLTFRLEKYLNIRQGVRRAISPFLILGLALIVIKPAWNYPKADEIKKMPVARFLDKNCPKPCTFFAFHGDIETINPTALYTGYTHGTRFPSYWFLPQLLRQTELLSQNKSKAYPEAKLLRTIEKYSLMAAEDLETYKPDILLIGTNIDIFGNGKNMNYVEYFSQNSVFKKSFFENYENTGKFQFDRAEYFRGTSLDRSLILTYDVYKRKDRNKN